MFPTEVTPLVPSLQSNWLTIHVITAALGQSILAISAVAGLVYLLKDVDMKKKVKRTFLVRSRNVFLCSCIRFCCCNSYI